MSADEPGGATRTNAERPGTEPPRSRAFVIVNTVMLVLATALATAALWPIYRSPQLLVMMGGATVLGCAIAIAGARWRWNSATVALTTVGVFVVAGVPLAVPSHALYGVLPSLDGLLDLLAGVALGWKQLLTISLPVGAYEALLVPFFALALVLTVVALSASLRSTRGGLAVFGPIVLFCAALLFGSTAEFSPVALALGMFATSLSWVALRRRFQRRALLTPAEAGSPVNLGAAEVHTALAAPTRAEATSVRRRGGAAWMRGALSAIVILVLAGSAAVGATTLLPASEDRDVLRSAVVQPFDPRDYVSPLSGFRKYWQQPAVDDVMFAVTGLPAGARLRIATLDTYNGVVYSVGSDDVNASSGSFTRVPYAVDQSDVDGRSIAVDVTVEGYTGPWVPTVGELETIDFSAGDSDELQDSFYFNDLTGTGAVLDGLSAGDTYSLNAVLPSAPDGEQLASLRPGASAQPAIGLVPDDLSLTLDGYVAGITEPGAQLAAMLDGLRASGYVSHGGDGEVASRSGHSADRITELFGDQRMIGDGEQYAVTAALMARQLGFPARVVFGFAPTGSDSGAAETVDVTGADVTAWIEVDTSRYGWVALDPNPEVREIPPELPQEPTVIARPQSIVPPPALEPAPIERQSAPQTQRDTPEESDPLRELILTVLRWVALSAFVVLVLLTPFLTVIALKAVRRRRRRRARTDRARIVGGWSEFQDIVVDHGYTPPISATRSEIAAVVGGPRPAVLAAVADRAVFAPSETDSGEADRVWRSVKELRRAMDANLTLPQRIRAQISLRSLGGYSGSNPFAR
jgi:transglutaminase-like putative cysteine protease